MIAVLIAGFHVRGSSFDKLRMRHTTRGVDALAATNFPHGEFIEPHTGIALKKSLLSAEAGSSSLAEIRDRSGNIRIIDELEAAVAAVLTSLGICGVFRVVGESLGCF